MAAAGIDSAFLRDLFLVGFAAVIGGAACRRLKVPEVLGYLIAGILLGPHVPPFAFVREIDTIRAIASFAVVFRMFALGLDFDPGRLAGYWRPALFAALLETGAGMAAGAALAPLLGWPTIEGAILGAALCTTSTNILSRALADRNMAATEPGRVAGAVTLVEDMISIVLLGLLAVGTGAPTPHEALARTGVLAVFGAVALSAGSLLVPRWLDELARSDSDELLTTAVVGLVFGLAALSAGLGAGPAIGAFLAGTVVAFARHAPGVAARILPVRDLLMAAFFVTVGMLLDPRVIVASALPAIGLTALYVVLKPIATATGLRLGGLPLVTAARAGAILGQTGTFGIVVAAGAFLAPEVGVRLFAFAFVAWGTTVALTPARLRYLPDVAERVARALAPARRRGGAIEPPRALPRGDERVPEDVRKAVVAWGAAVAFAGAAVVAAWALVAIAPAGLPLVAGAAALGAAAALAAAPWALAAGNAVRRLVHEALRRRAFDPTRLPRRGAASRKLAGPWAADFAAAASVLATSALLDYELAPPPAVAWLGVGALAALALLAIAWPLTRRLVRWAEALLESRPVETDPRLHGVVTHGPFGVVIEVVHVAPGTRAAGARVGDLALRQNAGATIAAILRRHSTAHEPASPHAVLHAGDEVVLSGTPARIEAARRYLGAAANARPLTRS